MAVLVTLHGLSKAFALRPLFKDLTFSIESGDRIGLIGPNGAGKSTLLKIIAGLTTQDEGTVSLQRGLRVGYLAQVPELDPNETILTTILGGTAPPNEYGGEYHGWEETARAEELIAKFELTTFGADALVGTLSGGWKKRVALAREWIKTPDLMLLDEPTNHLDLETILWLEAQLARAPFATLTITHDRLFLNRIANRILELDPRHSGGLLSVSGTYADFVIVREERINTQERRETVLKNTLRRETEWLRQGAKARTTKQQARIHRAEALGDEVEELTTRNQSRTARIDFQGTERNPKKLIEAIKISKSYGDRVVFKDFSLLLRPGSRIGLIGKNGIGKSTLIRRLTGEEKPSSGEVYQADQLSVAYFDQSRSALDPTLSVLKTLCPSGETVEFNNGKIHIRSYLDRFLFTTEKMEMAVGKLSGGEQARLLIAKLMLTPANVLVLDEPTNDLDMATLSVLEDCLKDFKGAVLLVTHDRYFLDQVSTQLFSFHQGQLLSFADILQWEAWLAREGVASAKAAKTAKQQAAGGGKPKQKLSYNDQRELDGMEAAILAAEEKVSLLTSASLDSSKASDAKFLSTIAADLSAAQAEVERLYARWSELQKS